MNLARRISVYAKNLKYHSISGESIHEAKRRLIDSLGCAAASFESAPARIARKMALRIHDPRGSTLLGTLHRTTPDMAAFHNGVLIRYLDYNDTYLSKEPAHPSDNISAALAVAEAFQKTGKDVLTAIILGYEIQCRLCDAASIRSRGWDHVTYGNFSTSVLSAHLMGGDVNEMIHAQGLSGVAHVAMRQTRVGELSMWKGCAFANAARNGVFSGMLAKMGMTGPAPIFEGTHGFCRQVSGPLRESSWGGGKIPFMILSTSMKFYPVEYHAQAAVALALEMKASLSKVDLIRSICVKTYRAAVEIIGQEREKWKPDSRETADHSLPYCIAVALLDARMGLAQFLEDRIRQTDVRSLMKKIRIHEDPKMTRCYPRSLPVEIEIYLSDGRTLRGQCEYAKGHARRPLTDDEVEEKFLRLTQEFFSRDRQRKILDRIWDLEKLKNITDLMKLCVIYEKKKKFI